MIKKKYNNIIIDINYRLRKFTPIEHFEAVFINKKFEIKEFGSSDRVLIFESDTTLINLEISFIQKNEFEANFSLSIIS